MKRPLSLLRPGREADVELAGVAFGAFFDPPLPGLFEKVDF